MSKTTIVISNYNYARYLPSAIESCLAQTVPCEIIVVDDASTDDSWNVIKSYTGSSVRGVRLKENSGGNARGKNVGICMSDTEYITCLDSDDMLLPTSIEDRMKWLEDHQFVHGWTHYVKGDGTYEQIMKLPKIKQKFSVGKKLAGKIKRSRINPVAWYGAIHGNTVLSLRSLYDTYGLYDEEMKWKVAKEMWRRWLSHGVSHHVLMKFVAIYRRHPGSVTKTIKLGTSPKNVQLTNKYMGRSKRERVNITPENTLMIPYYDLEDKILDTC